MADATAASRARRLPRGRHRLSREQVETDQRLRIAVGLTEAMWESGYVGTSVADIIKRAGVSRETFYRLYDDKADCFLAALDLVAAVLLDAVGSAATDGPLAERVRSVVTRYLHLLADEPASARLFLVEVNAAGAEAIARRAAVQDHLAELLVELLDVDRSERAASAVRVVIAAVASLVVPPLVAGDRDALLDIAPTIVEHVAELERAGVFGPDAGR